MKKKNCIAILGGSGFVGSEVCAQLVAAGYSVRLLTRNPDKCRSLKVLPSLSICPVSAYKAASISRYSGGCDALINLVGILNEKGNDGKQFHETHVGTTREALNACEQTGVSRIIQLSALNADPAADSYYLSTKGKAENYLKTFSDQHIHYTIYRPSVIFGEKDSFLNRFARILKYSPGIFPLACPNTRFAPVYVGDVARQIVHSVGEKSTFNRSYELCGPHSYTLKELVQYTAIICGYKRSIIGLPNALSRLQASVLEHFPGKPFSKDNYKSLQLDSICCDSSACLTSLQAVAPNYLCSNRIATKKYKTA